MEAGADYNGVYVSKEHDLKVLNKARAIAGLKPLDKMPVREKAEFNPVPKQHTQGVKNVESSRGQHIKQH